MDERNGDLHGNAPDHSPVALLIVDVLNDLEFPGGDQLLEPAEQAARRIVALRGRCREAGIPVIFANDNFGRWRSDFTEVADHVLNDGVLGEPLARLLHPGPDEYFVLKPKHSAFYSTTLDLLIRYLGARCVIITGLRADSCVLITASDAHMRDLEIYVPEDCVASFTAEHTREALDLMRRVLSVDTTPSEQLPLEALAGNSRAPGGAA
jgi:nicotinamidase-related amidase